MTYKIRKHYDRNGPLTRNKFYINVADFHLPRPQVKNSSSVDEHPIIFIDIGKAQ